MSDRAFTWVRDALGAADASFSPLKAEASFRAFYRVTLSGGEASAVLMVSPPEREHNDQFETLARVFAASDLPVPVILHRQPAEGWYVLSDLGQVDLEAVYGTPAEDRALECAIRTLVRLQTVRDPAIPPYTSERFGDELGIFREWFVEKLLGQSLPEAVTSIFDLLVDRTGHQQSCCVHRDYHCRNLLYDPATDQLGIVDFQDALIGPVSYDLASLLHDCYHEFDEATVRRWVDFYLSATDLELDRRCFAVDVDYMAVQRQLKAVGIFARLRLRDGRRTHLAHIIPVLAHLRGLTRQHEALAPLADWLAGLDTPKIAETIRGLSGP